MSAARVFFTAALGLATVAAAASDASAAVTGSTRFIPTALVYYGGGPTLAAADAIRLAKYDLIDVDRFRYREIRPNTWNAIKAYNPNAEIYLYEMGTESPNYLDASSTQSLNGIARYNVSRGHPMGSLNYDHPELYLLDSAGYRIYSNNFSNIYANRIWYLMDFGSPDYQTYWTTAVKADIVDQPWVADGVFADNCLTLPQSGGYSGVPLKYPTGADWSIAMNAFAAGVAGALHGYGQKLWCNKGDTRSDAGVAAWRSLDASADPPDVLMEEGAFAVGWGAAVQFFPEAEWKNQVDVLGAITNSKVAMLSHTKLAPGQTGIDDWGRPVTFWQAFYYAMGSLLLGKNATLNNAYLMFSSGTDYNQIVWFDEYDMIDLGQPLAPYAIGNLGAGNFYYRVFERGYVAVNPSPNDMYAIPLPEPCRLITHDMLYYPPEWNPPVNFFSLGAHSAAIILKVGS